MGSIYDRGGKLYLDYVDASGRRCQRSTGLAVGQEALAKEKLRAVERAIAAKRRANPDGPLTLAKWAEGWLTAREAQGIATVDDERSRLGKHVLPTLGHRPIAEITTAEVRELARALKAKVGPTRGELAPRTVLHCIAHLRQLMHDAAAESVIPFNPVILKRGRGGDLPQKRDKDPKWRGTAQFTREECEALISDPRIPEDRRVLTALYMLAGLRHGEAAARTWADYDRATEPLGKLSVHSSYSTDAHEVKATKTETPRTVPVHPVLAAILAAWKMTGWARMIGRRPGADDIIIPSREVDTKTGAPRHRNANKALERFHEDLERLGLRRRRIHDLRRSFITLARADGADRDLLRWVTHGVSTDIMDSYTTPPWETLCRQVSCLRIELREGKVVAFPMAAAAGAPDGATGDLRDTSVTVTEAARKTGEDRRGGRDSKTKSGSRLSVGESPDLSTSAGLSPAHVVTSEQERSATVTRLVTVPVTVPDPVGDALVEAVAAWREEPDRRVLRRRVLAVLQLLEEDGDA